MIDSVTINQIDLFQSNEKQTLKIHRSFDTGSVIFNSLRFVLDWILDQIGYSVQSLELLGGSSHGLESIEFLHK